MSHGVRAQKYIFSLVGDRGKILSSTVGAKSSFLLLGLVTITNYCICGWKVFFFLFLFYIVVAV